MLKNIFPAYSPKLLETMKVMNKMFHGSDSSSMRDQYCASSFNQFENDAGIPYHTEPYHNSDSNSYTVQNRYLNSTMYSQGEQYPREYQSQTNQKSYSSPRQISPQHWSSSSPIASSSQLNFKDMHHGPDDIIPFKVEQHSYNPNDYDNNNPLHIDAVISNQYTYGDSEDYLLPNCEDSKLLYTNVFSDSGRSNVSYDKFINENGVYNNISRNSSSPDCCSEKYNSDRLLHNTIHFDESTLIKEGPTTIGEIKLEKNDFIKENMNREYDDIYGRANQISHKLSEKVVHEVSVNTYIYICVCMGMCEDILMSSNVILFNNHNVILLIKIFITFVNYIIKTIYRQLMLIYLFNNY